jgi:hypothetical protein
LAKVREVLAKIGDGPLAEALKERGWRVYAKDNDFDMACDLEAAGAYRVFRDDQVKNEAPSAAEWLREEGYVVIEDLPHGSVNEGFEMYRQRRTDEFRQWLRDFFWQSLGRIA